MNKRSSWRYYSIIPWTTFLDSEVARVGLNEQEAKDRGIACEVTRYKLNDLDRAITDGAAHGFIKVLTVPGKEHDKSMEPTGFCEIVQCNNG